MNPSQPLAEEEEPARGGRVCLPFMPLDLPSIAGCGGRSGGAEKTESAERKAAPWSLGRVSGEFGGGGVGAFTRVSLRRHILGVGGNVGLSEVRFQAPFNGGGLPFLHPASQYYSISVIFFRSISSLLGGGSRRTAATFFKYTFLPPPLPSWSLLYLIYSEASFQVHGDVYGKNN